MARSATGMNRAAQEGRYTGGIVPLGYLVEGRKQHARLVPSDKLIWGNWTEADLVRQIYHWLAIEGWSCPRIAEHLNILGVPTAYTKDDRLLRRGQLKERTQGLWRAGRIRNLVKKPVYRGELQYGRRSARPDGREVIAAEIPPLVSRDIWEAAQLTLSGNRLMAAMYGSIPAWAGEPPSQRPTRRHMRVYPRVGGGTVERHWHIGREKGLSPRGRGNHPRRCICCLLRRSIPAWAGEPT